MPLEGIFYGGRLPPLSCWRSPSSVNLAPAPILFFFSILNSDVRKARRGDTWPTPYIHTPLAARVVLILYSLADWNWTHSSFNWWSHGKCGCVVAITDIQCPLYLLKADMIRRWLTLPLLAKSGHPVQNCFLATYVDNVRDLAEVISQFLMVKYNFAQLRED